MRALVPTAWTTARNQLQQLLVQHRANLRARSYRDPMLNAPKVPPQETFVTASDGAQLRVHSYGPSDGPVVVLAHGWTCCLEYWYPQINALADTYRVIAYDQRGHGASAMGPAPLTWDLLADDLAAVLGAVLAPRERAVLVGHSLGGMTIQAWAARYPQQVTAAASAVVLLNTGPHSLVAETTVVPLFNAPIRWLSDRTIALPFWLGRGGLGAPMVFPPVAPVRWIFARQVMSLAASRELVDFGLNIVRSCPVSVRSKFGFLLADMDLGDAAKQLTVPTTVLAGENDDLTPVVHAERLAALLGEWLVRLRVLPTGHLGGVEAYAQVNAELLTVLASCPQPADQNASISAAG